MSPRVVQTIAENPKLMPWIHIPFQSGDNEVLKFMRRGYTRESYLHLINNIRTLIPDASITADCIVGFPGETEEQFQNTLKLMEEVKFDMIITAAYSPRPGTPAANWDNQVEEDVKQDRLQRINELASEHAQERSNRFVGRIQPVLVQDVDPKNGLVIGRNPHAKLVFFEGDFAKLQGKTVNIRIIQARPYRLVGELVL
jgi:tRNA-2-methylthio-N6-dimethylallyladenosine synthase